MRPIDADVMKDDMQDFTETGLGEMIKAWIDMQPTLESKAAKPIIQEAKDAFNMECRWYSCGECQTPIDPCDHYCRHCGTMVLW